MAVPSKVVIVEPDPEWPGIFTRLKSVYEIFLKGKILAIHHVGSTSVPGLQAKPIIDIDLEIEKAEDFAPVKKLLEELGYLFIGDCGIKERYAFRQSSAKTPDDGTNSMWYAHNLYVCQTGNVALQNHIMFRDYLIANPAKAKEYGRLKKQLAETGCELDDYTEAKTTFIIGVLREKGFDPAILQSIMEQNKAK